MDYKKNDIIKSLEELTLVFNTSIDCSKTPKFCNFSNLLTQTINKTILYLEQNENKSENINKIVSPDININYQQLSSLYKTTCINK